jgi:predicted O-methyltransferase YrrM
LDKGIYGLKSDGFATYASCSDFALFWFDSFDSYKMTAFRQFVRSSFIGRVLLLPWRLWCALRTTLQPVWAAIKWTFLSREHYNYTYDLQPMSVDYLVAMLSVITAKPQEQIANYIREAEGDERLKAHIIRETMKSPERHVADPEVRFGRRLGWYALVRALKPQVVVETGVDKGLGSCLLVSALQRNAAEGQPGKLIGIDINPKAGYLVQHPYDQPCQMVYADSLATLAGLKESVDVFIHDSDHSPEFETKEYESVTSKLSPRAVVVSDNAAHTDRLLRWARENGREFIYFAEQPARHWWPGEGIGIAFRGRMGNP